MPYTTPIDSGTDDYILVMRHEASGIIVEQKIAGIEPGFPNPSRATKDAVFQALVNKMASIAGTTIIAARRTINYTSDVTPSAP